MVGWVTPSMTVADGTLDCDSVAVCAARWSLMASGDGMTYVFKWTLLWRSPCHGKMGSLFGGHCQQHIYRATEHSSDFSRQTVLCSVFLCLY